MKAMQGRLQGPLQGPGRGPMQRALLAYALVPALAGLAGLAGLTGCVTTAAIARPDHVSLPLLAGAAVADLAVVTLLASQAQDFSAGASVAAAVAVTAVDVGAGCILGACRSLRP